MISKLEIIVLALFVTSSLAVAGAPVFPRFLCSSYGFYNGVRTQSYYTAFDNCNSLSMNISVVIVDNNGAVISPTTFYTVPPGISYFPTSWFAANLVVAFNSGSTPYSIKVTAGTVVTTEQIPCWSSTNPGCNNYGFLFQCNLAAPRYIGYSKCTMPDRFVSNGLNSMPQNYFLQSLNGNYNLLMQTDGNLVLYNSLVFIPSNAVWSTGTAGLGTPPYRFTLQSDSSLAIYDGSNILRWTMPQRSSSAPYMLIMQTDRNVVAYGANLVPYWSSGTWI